MGERLVRAAGGVVWQTRDGEAEVAVVHRPRYDDWSLPKGKAIKREHPLDTACREVREETGIRPVLGPRLPTQRYRSPAGPKVVHYWAMSPGLDSAFIPTAEVDQVVWLPVPEARTLLTYRRDITVLDGLAQATSMNAVVLLVRHASAVRCRRASAGNLDRRGHRQAQALRRVLPAFAPSRLVCAPDSRRRETLTPLAAHLRMPMTPDPDLTGRRSPSRPSRCVTRLRELASKHGTTVVAAPGTLIRGVVAALADEDGVPVTATDAKKGSVWALFFHNGRLTAADYYPALTRPEE